MLDSNPILNISNLHFSYNISKYSNSFEFKDILIEGIRNPFTFFSPSTQLSIFDGANAVTYNGDRIGVLGVNGTGKTTLCRLILNILKPQWGEISINGKTRALFSSSPCIYPDLTGRENAELIACLMYPHMGKEERSELISSVFEFCELQKFDALPFQHYSKGMQNRLYLSLASARASDLLILDEVFDGADIFFREKSKPRFLEMIDNCKTTLFVSHSLENILEICNKVWVIKGGKIIEFSSVEKGIAFYRLH